MPGGSAREADANLATRYLMHEPYLAEFKRLIRAGAATQDVHDVATNEDLAAAHRTVSDAFIKREVERVATHQRSLTPLLEATVGRATRILDFGCGTGGTTVALALSSLGAEEIIGIDANVRALEAATVRAAGYSLAPPKVRFLALLVGMSLPFPDGHFDLVTAVSVLEFITQTHLRKCTVAELRRVVRPGGFLYIATPRVGIREYHSRRLLGDLLRSPGLPWSSPPWEVASWTDGWERVSLTTPLALRVTARLPWLPTKLVERGLGPALPCLSRWRKVLLRRP